LAVVCFGVSASVPRNIGDRVKRLGFRYFRKIRFCGHGSELITGDPLRRLPSVDKIMKEQFERFTKNVVIVFTKS